MHPELENMARRHDTGAAVVAAKRPRGDPPTRRARDGRAGKSADFVVLTQIRWTHHKHERIAELPAGPKGRSAELRADFATAQRATVSKLSDLMLRARVV